MRLSRADQAPGVAPGAPVLASLASNAAVRVGESGSFLAVGQVLAGMEPRSWSLSAAVCSGHLRERRDRTSVRSRQGSADPATHWTLSSLTKSEACPPAQLPRSARPPPGRRGPNSAEGVSTDLWANRRTLLLADLDDHKALYSTPVWGESPTDPRAGAAGCPAVRPADFQGLNDVDHPSASPLTRRRGRTARSRPAPGD